VILWNVNWKTPLLGTVISGGAGEVDEEPAAEDDPLVEDDPEEP
jgi:hypothetical protein